MFYPGLDFTFGFSYSDDETDEITLVGGERDALCRALREVAGEAIALVKKLEDQYATETTVPTMAEAAPILAALEVLDAEYRNEGGMLDGGLKRLRYRIRGHRF
jgi:hypothetical protein